MEVTNEEQKVTGGLTIGDLGVAAWACSEIFNFMLEGYNEEDYGDMSKEQVEETLERLRTSFIKFDTLARALIGNEEAEHDEDEPWSE